VHIGGVVGEFKVRSVTVPKVAPPSVLFLIIILVVPPVSSAHTIHTRFPETAIEGSLADVPAALSNVVALPKTTEGTASAFGIDVETSIPNNKVPRKINVSNDLFGLDFSNTVII
jgi:hypothetical protein